MSLLFGLQSFIAAYHAAAVYKTLGEEDITQLLSVQSQHMPSTMVIAHFVLFKSSHFGIAGN
jgi:hypothetical protein